MQLAHNGLCIRCPCFAQSVVARGEEVDRPGQVPPGVGGYREQATFGQWAIVC